MCQEALTHLHALYSTHGAPILRSDFAEELSFQPVSFGADRQMAAVTGHGPQALYRLFTSFGLGYVGIAGDWRARIPAHRRKAWWHEIIGIHVHQVDSRAVAVALEAVVIERSHPPFNLAGPSVSGYFDALRQLADADLERQEATG